MAPHILIPKLPAKTGSGSRVLELLDAMVDFSNTEKGNSTYFFFTKEDDPDLIWGIEEYDQRSDLYDLHMPSEDFKKFAGTLEKEGLFGGELQFGNYEPHSGFLSRPGVSTSGKFVWIAELECTSSAARDEVLALGKSLTSYVHENEPKTLSYLFLKSLDNDKLATVFEIYENKEALTGIHHKSEQFLTFGKTLAEKKLVAGKTATGFKTIGKGYLGKDGRGLGLRK